MSDDPYDNMPSLEDLQAAGATDWFSDAIAEQKKRNASLKAALGAETSSLKSERKSLEELMNDAVQQPSPEDVPDLFAEERADVAKGNAAAGSLLDDLKAAQAREKAKLKDLFN